MIKKINFKILILAVVCFFSGWYLGSLDFGSAPPVRPQMLAPQIIAQKLTEQNIHTNYRFIAEVQPINIVSLRPQVSGILQEIKFNDGSFVKEGDILFVIEQERYKANLLAAQAALRREQSNLDQQQRNHDRQTSLYKRNSISKSAFESSEATLVQAKANAELARSNVELAQIDLNHTVIKAPISGYIGTALVTRGNFVDLSTQSLARIVQTNPIRISFSLTDRERLFMMQEGKTRDDIKLNVRLSNGKMLNASADAFFMDNEVNRTTNTLPVYLEHPNQDRILLPGNYVDLIATLSNENVLSIPQTALGIDNQGSYVMVVDDDGIAWQRYVTIGQGSHGMQTITEGLKVGETIIIEGLQRVQNGQKVSITLVNN